MFLRKLHPCFCARKLSEHVLKVGISHVLPASEEYDFLNECSYKEKTDNWDAFTVAKFREILENANSLKFRSNYCVNGHYLGKVLIEEKTGKFEDAAEILLEMGRAVETVKQATFMDELKKIETFNCERYQDNDRRNIRPLQKMTKVEQQGRQQNQFVARKVKQMQHCAQNVEVIECYDDMPVNEIPKNIPVEMHPNNKVTRWLNKYVEGPTVQDDDTVNDTIDDSAKPMPLLIARKSFQLKTQDKVPAPLRRIQTHNVTRPTKIYPVEADQKSEINVSKCGEAKKDPVPSVTSPFLLNLLKKLQLKQETRKKAAANELESSKMIEVTSTVETKRTLNIFPADYAQIKGQIERNKRLHPMDNQTDTASIYTSRTFTTHKSKPQPDTRRRFPAATTKNFNKTVLKDHEEEKW